MFASEDDVRDLQALIDRTFSRADEVGWDS
jgi:hypothetical protein